MRLGFLLMVGGQMYMQNVVPITLAFCGQHRASDMDTLFRGGMVHLEGDGGKGKVEYASH